jgi:predicted RNA binding protein YcfA (HicA-like mRNA interferase family)
MPGKIKINFKMPPETAAEKMYRKHQELRKKSGLPDPSHYKNLAAQKQKEIDAMKNEDVEMLDEMPESSMKTRDVHAHLKKSGWALARSSGGHDVYKHPKAKHSIPVPRHNQLKAPLIRGIMKASRVSEETEIEEQLEKKGRFVSGPPKKTFKSSTIVSAMREAKDPREYDYEGDMAMSQLRSLVFNAEDMMDMMDENTNLPEWVQSKITLAEDYVSTAANYLRGELNEEVKDEYARKVDKYLKKKYGKDKQPQGADFAAQRRKERLAKNSRMDESDASWAAAKEKEKEKRLTSKDQSSLAKIRDMMAKERTAKAAKMKEEVELNEGRPSQRHPLEGHDYHKKSNAELVGIAKDAHAAAEAMKGHSPQSENKYRDQANDSATVRYFRQKSGMPDWYKKKYGHVKEETEYLEEKNVPTSPEKWAQAKSQAKSKFDVYPSAYANGWAAKKYKEMGGDWKSVKEETEKPASRKAQIVKDIMKNKKNQDETSDKFQKDPEISSEIQKN